MDITLNKGLDGRKGTQTAVGKSIDAPVDKRKINGKQGKWMGRWVSEWMVHINE